jgi:hypothetical protein
VLKSEPKTFSEAYGLSSVDVTKAGAVNVTINCDTKLFVDPLLLAEASDKEFRECATKAYRERFELVIKLLKLTKTGEDKAWQAAKKHLSFPEIHTTHLGYSSSKSGSGFGPFLTDTLIQSAKEVIDLGVEDPDLFVALALFEENVGADRISDMTCNIVLRCLVEFTQRVSKSLNVALKPHKLPQLGNTLVELPDNPLHSGRPIVLVPNDIVRDLPVASDWDSVDAAAQENQDLRDRVNAQIGEIWSAKTKKEKANYRKALTASKKSFETFLELIKLAADSPYDVQTDHNGELYPSDVKAQIAAQFPLDLSAFSNKKLSEADALQVVEEIIAHFRHLVEDNGLWRLLWNDKTNKPKHEKASQLLFFAVASTYCKVNDLDLTPEANAGMGPVDFKVSHGAQIKVLVEVKKSTGKLLSGYTKQLEIYKKSEETKHAHYVVVDINNLNSSKKADLEALHDAANAEGFASKLWFVDATAKVSASKS